MSRQSETVDLQSKDYDPNAFIDWLVDTLKCRNDAALCRKLGVDKPVISNVRHRRRQVPAPMIIAIHEETGMRTKDIKARMFRNLGRG